MSDSFSETTTVGWGSRLMDSIKGVFFGLILAGISVAVLFWNEGRAVHRQQALEEGASSVVAVSADKVDSANESKLIHVSGEAKSAEGLADDQFDIKAPGALRLNRTVEMYQWEQKEHTESKKNVGGSEERTTTYTYETVWSSREINSSSFKKIGHNNPGSIPYGGSSKNATDATLAAFKLNDLILDSLSPNKTLVPAEATKPAVDGKQKPAYTVSNGMLYLGNASSPKIGDVRIAFKELPPGPISIVARQIKDTFETYKAKTGDVLLVQSGLVSADAMFKQAEDENKMITWIIRAAGFVFIVIGFSMLFGPFVTLADVIPFIGSIISVGTFIGAFVCAIPVWLITVGIAWLYYRPVLGIALIAGAIAVPILFKMMRSPKPATA